MGKVLAILLVFAIPVSGGDPEVAEFLLEKGQKEARAKNYEEAENLLRRSIAEYPPNPEACFEHGQVLEKLDRAQEAGAAYNACIEAVDKAESPPSKWKVVARRVARALSKLKKQFEALHKINKKYLPKFLAFGKQQYKSNPRWSRRAFEAVLAIDPTNSSAKAYLAKLPAEGEDPAKQAPVKGKPWGKSLIDPDGELKDWEPGECEFWSLRRGVIVGDSSEHSGHINWLNSPEVHGKYALQVKFRVLRDGSNRRTFGVIIGDGKGDFWSVIVDSDNALAIVRFAEKNSVITSRDLDPKIRLADWHTLRIVVDNDRSVEVFVDDKAILEMEVPRRQPFAGQMAFFIQEVKVEFKDLELRK